MKLNVKHLVFFRNVLLCVSGGKTLSRHGKLCVRFEYLFCCSFGRPSDTEGRGCGVYTDLSVKRRRMNWGAGKHQPRALRETSSLFVVESGVAELKHETLVPRSRAAVLLHVSVL